MRQSNRSAPAEPARTVRAPHVVEVGPRDGLQSEATVLSVDDRLELIHRLIAAGATRIEVASFVNPKRVPQMGGAEEIVAGLTKQADTRAIGLVLNRRGLDRALATAVDEVNFSLAASDGYNVNNQGATVDESLAEIGQMIAEARDAGRWTSVTVSVAFGCPYDGEVPPHRLDRVIEPIVDSGIDEIAFGDTIGVATPADVRERLGKWAERPDRPQLRCHFHNTRNTAYANVVAAVDLGVEAIDASVGGYGGSPFAPNAGGNVATEDLAYLLTGMGVDPGLDSDRLVEVTAWLAAKLDSPARSMLPAAGPFPPRDGPNN